MKELFSFLDADQVSDEISCRCLYSRDSWTKATFLEQKNEWPRKTALVLFPEREEEVVRIVKTCAAHKIRFLPYGGGSGVCGAAVPAEGQVIVDLKRMDQIKRFDPISHTVEVEAGALGVDLENYLNQKGFTLGHFPSSMNAASIGGYLACRSAGQCSSRYGKIEDMVLGMRVVLPSGKLVCLPSAPRHAMGPDFLQLFTGAEGQLGIITSARFVIRRLPRERRFFSFVFPRVESGLDFMRQAMQHQLRPAIFRLYDPLDTMVLKMTYRKKRKKRKLPLQQLFLSYPFFFQKFLPLVEQREVLLVTVLEGEKEEVDYIEKKLLELLKPAPGRLDKEEWAKSFFEHRFRINFFLPQVMQKGFITDTCEVVGFWKDLSQLYHNMRRAVGDKAIVFAHFSHAYETGCCIYFTFLCRLEDYDAVWESLMEACGRSGGCLSHHHGIGRLKRWALEKFYPDQALLWDHARKMVEAIQ